MAELQRQQLGGHVQGVRLVALDHRLRPLDGIRALAVLAVLATHAGIPFLPGGFVGVDVFFVLSGFLITSLLYEEDIDADEAARQERRSEEHTSNSSHQIISYAVFCLKKKKT